MPPMAAPTGIPSITALPNFDFPGSQPFCSSIGMQRPKKTSAVGISARNMDTTQVPSMMASSTALALLPNAGSTYNEILLPRPTLVNIWPITMAARRKKGPVDEKFASMVPSFSKPTHAPKNNTNIAVTAIGTASVSHSSTATNSTRKPSQPFWSRPLGTKLGRIKNAPKSRIRYTHFLIFSFFISKTSPFLFCRFCQGHFALAFRSSCFSLNDKNIS